MKIINMNFGILRKFDRHFRIQLKYLTVKKFFNILTALTEYLFCARKLKSKPFLLKIEPSSFCNLKCLGCRTGVEDNFKDGTMPLERYKEIIDELGSSLIEVVLYLWGEPLINKKIIEMVSYASEKNIGSVISTNVHFLTKEVSEGLVRAKLDKLIVCIDGLDQETYEDIRAGGNLEVVMKNFYTLLETRKESGARYPLVEWQFIRTDSNEHQIEEARALAAKKGVDVFTVMEDLSKRRDQKNKSTSGSKKSLLDKRCPWLWFALAVQWDGSIYPCCHYARDEKNRFGQMSETSLCESWNSDPFLKSRAHFSDSSLKEDTVCYKCIHYQTGKH